ncbi:hypothetical protein CEXT_148351, partial [Caerostris extrusa]
MGTINIQAGKCSRFVREDCECSGAILHESGH